MTKDSNNRKFEATATHDKYGNSINPQRPDVELVAKASNLDELIEVLAGLEQPQHDLNVSLGTMLYILTLIREDKNNG